MEFLVEFCPDELEDLDKGIVLDRRGGEPPIMGGDPTLGGVDARDAVSMELRGDSTTMVSGGGGPSSRFAGYGGNSPECKISQPLGVSIACT
jgi:hypothetical protein